MAHPLGPPRGMHRWNAGLVLILGFIFVVAGVKTSSGTQFGVGGLLLVSAYGFWKRLPWAKWLTLLAIASFAGRSIVGMAMQGFDWTSTITLLGVVGFAVELLRDKKPNEEKSVGDKEGDPPKPLTSFVLLLDGPRSLTAAQLAPIVSRAWGGTYQSTDDVEKDKEGQRWVGGKSPIFVMKSDEAIFMLHNFPSPYSANSEEMAATVPDLRLRHAIREHRAWLAVDLLHPFDGARSPNSFYPAIARLIAELAGDDCLAVFHPESNRINAWDETLKAALRGPDPLRHFAKAVNPPVLQVADDDPELLAGKEEARRRLPEFIDAFRRKDGEHFSVKAPVTAGGRTEHIWIEVDGVGDHRIDGRLGNEPVNLGGMKLGDRVDVAPSQVEDWVIVRGGSPVGLFTARTVGRSLRKS